MKCYYCGKESQGGKIEELDNNIDLGIVDCCDECLIQQGYNPKEYKD